MFYIRYHSDEGSAVHTSAAWDDPSGSRSPDTVLVIVEPGSTHTGNNVEYTMQLLRRCGCVVTPELVSRAVFAQQPALLARAGATVRKWTGVCVRGHFNTAPFVS